MNTTRWKCPHCKTTFWIVVRMADKSVRCPKCSRYSGQVFRKLDPHFQLASASHQPCPSPASSNGAPPRVEGFQERTVNKEG